MSYDIYIVDVEGNTITSDEKHNVSGGTYELGGSNELWLNITYNYSEYFYRYFGKDGIRSLYGKSVADTMSDIARAIVFMREEAVTFVPPETKEELDINNPSKFKIVKFDPDNYWSKTPMNAAKALKNLLDIGAMAPEGFWKGD